MSQLSGYNRFSSPDAVPEHRADSEPPLTDDLLKHQQPLAPKPSYPDGYPTGPDGLPGDVK